MEKTLKTLLLTAICCLFVSSAYAQRYYDDRRNEIGRTGSVASYLDLHLGEGVGRGAKAIGGGDFSFLARLSPEFQFGVGIGLDYVHALALQGKLNNKSEYDYHGELTMPLFLRGRYLLGDTYSRGANYFVQCDLGYRFGISAYNTGKEKNLAKNLEKCNVKGFFIEPQFGIAINDIISLSFGLPFQRYTKIISNLPVAETTKDTPTSTKGLMFMGADLHFIIGF
jgi:hypothetical protein